jgi:lipopolysaccharide biosynthesis regulator YciM
MELGIAILLVIGLAVFTVTPLLAPDGPSEDALPIDVTPLTDLKRRRMVVYENLQDLEFEYKAGKVAKDDYQSLRENHLAEAAQLMLASQEQEEVTEHDLMIERQVAERRAQRKSQRPDPYVCPECGFENPLPVKFCGNCGKELPLQPRGK